MSDLKRSYGPEDYSISEYLTYFFDIGVECPYGIKEKAVYRQQQFVSLPDPLLAKFLRAGFRRNGNTLYTMVCPNCRNVHQSACIQRNLRLTETRKGFLEEMRTLISP